MPNGWWILWGSFGYSQWYQSRPSETAIRIRAVEGWFCVHIPLPACLCKIPELKLSTLLKLDIFIVFFTVIFLHAELPVNAARRYPRTEKQPIPGIFVKILSSICSSGTCTITCGPQTYNDFNSITSKHYKKYPQKTSTNHIKYSLLRNTKHINLN